MLSRNYSARKRKVQVVAAAFAADVDRFAADIQVFCYPALQCFIIDLITGDAASARLRPVIALVSDDFKNQLFSAFRRRLKLVFA